MAAQILFKVKLRAHGEVSPALIQRLRAVRLYVDHLFGPPDAVVRHEVDVSYEQICPNGIHRTEGWNLDCNQPTFIGDPDFPYDQYHNLSRDCTGATPPSKNQGDSSVGPSPGLGFDQQFDAFLALPTPSSIYSGEREQGSLTNRYDHEYTARGRSMSQRGSSANRSKTRQWSWKAYNPDTSDGGSARDVKIAQHRIDKRR